MKQFLSKSVVIAVFAAATVLAVLFAVNSMTKHVTIVIDGREQVIQTFKGTVEDVLEEQGIQLGAKDKIDRPATAVLSRTDSITITRAVPVTLIADGAIQSYMTAERTVRDFFRKELVELGQEDKITTSLLASIQPGMEIAITRVSRERVEEMRDIEFAVAEKKDGTLLRGKRAVTQEGQEGELLIVKERVYEDGILVDEYVVEEQVVKEPVDKVIAVGTKAPPRVITASIRPTAANVYAARGGPIPTSLSYSHTFIVEATAYSNDPITAIGTVPVRNPSGWSTIAVDRNVIPLGTKVYVENYGYAIAEDVGGAIRGNMIDIYLNNRTETRSWGRRNVRIYILD